MKFTVYTFTDLSDEIDLFFKNYTFENFIICPIEKIKNLKPKKERICRFCGLDYSQTAFKNQPHIISELLGNKYLVSDFECDICNGIFSKYENDLACFLGMSRTFLGVKNKENKFPTFKSPGDMLIARRMEFYGVKDGIKISINELAKNILNIDDKVGRTEIKYQKQRYIPIKVYKALLKIALSIIPENYVADYQYAFKYLFHSNDKLSDIAKIAHYELPYNHLVANPICFLFKKLEPANRITNHVFALYFQNHIFEFPIPLCKVDIDNNLYNGIPYSIPLCPPLLFSKPDLEAKYYRSIKDLSSNEPVNEEETITFSFDPNILNNLKAYNPTTGEDTDAPFIADDIAAIYIAPYNPKASFPRA